MTLNDIIMKARENTVSRKFQTSVHGEDALMDLGSHCTNQTLFYVLGITPKSKANVSALWKMAGSLHWPF